MTKHEIRLIKKIGNILKIETENGEIYRVQGCSVDITVPQDLVLEVIGDSVELKQK